MSRLDPIMIGIFSLIAGLCFLGMVTAGVAYAADDENKRKVVSKNVIGIVDYIDSRHINIVYARDEKTKADYEIGFRLNEDIELLHIRELGRLKRGDKVKLIYDEIQEKYEAVNEDGSIAQKTKVSGREARSIVFIRSANRSARPALSS